MNCARLKRASALRLLKFTARFEIGDQARTITALQSTALELEKQADLTHAQRSAGTVDELTLVAAEVAAANAEATIEGAELLERLQYASLQNLAGGNWLWVQ